MSLEISAKTIEPIRLTYSHVARRIGAGKPASRYQEATYDIQPTANFHYRPLWDVDHEIYDTSRTAIVMADWYSFTDPRQFYYGVYTQTRAKQQSDADNNFNFVEKNGLAAALSDSTKRKVRDFLIPLRHTEWGANMNNCAITDEGYGVSITQVTMFNAIDRLGIAQYLTRMSLLLESNDTSGLDAAKDAWLSNEIWQGLRKAVEDSFVLDDWFETMVAQNIVMDGLVYPLLFGRLVDEIKSSNDVAVAMMTEFQNEWYAETVRWTNALVKTTAHESDTNAALLSQWIGAWIESINEALLPIAAAAFGNNGAEQLQLVRQQLEDRLTKQGIKV